MKYSRHMETCKPFIIVNIHYTDIPRGSTNNDFLKTLIYAISLQFCFLKTLIYIRNFITIWLWSIHVILHFEEFDIRNFITIFLNFIHAILLQFCLSKNLVLVISLYFITILLLEDFDLRNLITIFFLKNFIHAILLQFWLLKNLIYL